MVSPGVAGAKQMGATFFFAFVPFPTNESTRMKSVHRATIWRELLWGAAALALMIVAFLFVYLPA